MSSSIVSKSNILKNNNNFEKKNEFDKRINQAKNLTGKSINKIDDNIQDFGIYQKIQFNLL